MTDTSIFDYFKTPLKIDKPIRLIELFAGVGSQAKALARLGANFEHYRISEWEVNATASYKAIHKGEDSTDYSAEFTNDELTEILFNIGISTDGKKPLGLKEIARKGEQWKRTVYNNFKATNNIGSVMNVGGSELGIVDTDKYCYVMTYSFPCQDLSLAGKQKGMAKGGNTRSSLLWEVERLLNECDELPRILLMENVTQVHGSKNKGHFDEWIEFLESKGYSNYWQDLNSKNFGVPQNRNRTFMVSVLGEYTYEFPQEFPLKLRLKDMLEDAVDEKFYLSGKMISYFQENTKKQQAKGNGFKFTPTDGSGCDRAVTTRAGGRMDDNFIEEQPVLIGGMQKNQAVKTDGISTTLTSSMGMGGGYVPMVTEPKCEQAGILTGGKWDKMHDVSRRVYSEDGIAPTLHTCGGGNTEPKVIAGVGEKKSNGGTQRYQQDRIYDDDVAISVTTTCNPYYATAMRGRTNENGEIEQNVEVSDREYANAITTVQKDSMVAEPVIIEDFYKNRDERVYEGVAPTLRSERNGLKVAELMVVGEPLAYDEQNGYIRKDGTVGTLTTDGSSPKHNNRVIENCYVSEKGVRFICSPKRGMTTDINADISQPLTAKGQANWTGSFVSPDIESLEKSSTIGSTEPTKINLKDGETVYFDGKDFTSVEKTKELVDEVENGKYPKDTAFGKFLFQSSRFDDKPLEECAQTIKSTKVDCGVITNLRIRKLTPKECWRLMGFDDADFEKAAAVNSNSQLYKQAGNSIVVDVLCYIFGMML